jgi:hypothetical protein
MEHCVAFIFIIRTKFLRIRKTCGKWGLSSTKALATFYTIKPELISRRIHPQCG